MKSHILEIETLVEVISEAKKTLSALPGQLNEMDGSIDHETHIQPISAVTYTLGNVIENMLRIVERAVIANGRATI